MLLANFYTQLLGCDFLRLFTFDLIQTVNAIEVKSDFEAIVRNLKNDFSEVFKDELGTYKLGKVSLQISPDAKPIFFKPRPVPLAWKGKLKTIYVI